MLGFYNANQPPKWNRRTGRGETPHVARRHLRTRTRHVACDALAPPLLLRDVPGPAVVVYESLGRPELLLIQVRRLPVRHPVHHIHPLPAPICPHRVLLPRPRHVVLREQRHRVRRPAEERPRPARDIERREQVAPDRARVLPPKHIQRPCPARDAHAVVRERLLVRPLGAPAARVEEVRGDAAPALALEVEVVDGGEAAEEVGLAGVHGHLAVEEGVRVRGELAPAVHAREVEAPEVFVHLGRAGALPATDVQATCCDTEWSAKLARTWKCAGANSCK